MASVEPAKAPAPWPLQFRMIPPPSPPELPPPAGPQFWSHELYRGPNGQEVKVLYSHTKAESERIAQHFLGEKVIGFDMEWPWQSDSEKGTLPLQKRIGLIQIACEDKIALFHIGRHHGKTSQDILAPSLRRIIESPDITKTGVAILTADFSRLRKWFGLSPRGAFELSHLHNLVVYGQTEPQSVTTRMRRLSEQVELHLGSPLHKGKVRTSNWSWQLNPQQIKYAAADAYAGFMLFHCMNAKRTSMTPTPPLPLHADLYQQLGHGMGIITPVQLGPHGEVTAISSFEFFKVPVQARPTTQRANGPSTKVAENKPEGTDHDRPPASLAGGSGHLVKVGRCGKHVMLERRAVDDSTQASAEITQRQTDHTHSGNTPPRPKKTAGTAKVSQAAVLDEADTKALFEQLRMHRKGLAKERKCSAFIIASNVLLDAISRECPRNEQELLQIRGIGRRKAKDFGPAWLEIIREFLKLKAPGVLEADATPVHPKPALSTTSPPDQKPLPNKTMQDIAGGAALAHPVLSTGLSFTLERTTLADGAEALNLMASQGSEDSLAIGSSIRSPSPSPLKRKREMVGIAVRGPTTRRLSAAQSTAGLGHSARSPRGELESEEEGQAAQSLQMCFEIEAASSPSSRNTQITPWVNPPGPAVQEGNTGLLATAPGPKPKKTGPVGRQIFRNKIVAFNKLVTPAVVLSDATIDQIVEKPPRTVEELLRIPGVMPFANVCARLDRSFLDFIIKATPEQVPSIA